MRHHSVLDSIAIVLSLAVWLNFRLRNLHDMIFRAAHVFLVSTRPHAGIPGGVHVALGAIF